MTTVYAVRLNGNTGVDCDDSFLSIVDSIARWAEIDDPFKSQESTGRRNARVITEYFTAPASGNTGWTLRLTHPDSEDNSIRWGTYITVYKSHTVDVSIELDRTRIDGTVTAIEDNPQPPRIVSGLVDSTDGFVDGGRTLSTDVIVVDHENASAFASLVTSPTRRLPIFGFTGRDEDAIDASPLTRSLVGLVHVAFIRPTASWALNDFLPEGFNVYGGAARLWWPKITLSSTAQERWNHPLWTGTTPARTILAEAQKAVLDAGLSAWMHDPRILQLRREIATSRSDERNREIEELRKKLNDLSSSQISSFETFGDDSLRTVRQELEQATQERIDDLEADNSFYLEEAIRLEEELAKTKLLLNSTESQLANWMKTALELQRGETPDSPLTPELKFRSEIQDEIECRAESPGANFREFKMGRAFLGTVEQIGTEFHSKIIKACADMVINSPDTRRRRDHHILRDGAGPNNPQRIRATDGATAWRCAIEQGRAGARRIHYWAISSTEIEFAAVVVHDDSSIPE
jgi:hypothetical protein